MRQKQRPEKDPAETVVKEIRRATRKHYSAEEKIRIVLKGLRGEDSIAELCRRGGIPPNVYHRWSKDFLEAGKKRLAGDTAREATSGEVRSLRREAAALKEVVADLTLENRLLKKACAGMARKAHEVPGIREDRHHPSGRAIPSVRARDPGQDRHPTGHLLPVVRSLPDRRA